MPKRTALTARQRRFVGEYLVDLNATQAAVRAGYSPTTAPEQASRLLTNVKVAAAVTAAQTKRAERTEVTQDYVLTNLTEIVQRCMDKQTFDARGATGALTLLGKHLAMFTEKLEHSGANGAALIPPGAIQVMLVAAMQQTDGNGNGDGDSD